MEILWAFLIIGGPIILGAALIYGTFQYRRRNRNLDSVSEAGAAQVREDLRREETRAGQR